MSLGAGVALLLWRLANRVRSRRTVVLIPVGLGSLISRHVLTGPGVCTVFTFSRYRNFFPGVKWPESDIGTAYSEVKEAQFTLEQAMKAQRRSRDIALLFNFGARWGWVVNATPRTLYPMYRRMGGPQARSGRVRKISPTPGFDPRTFEPVANSYTDCAIPAHAPFGSEVKNVWSYTATPLAWSGTT
jgi:hypothetical protein